MKSTAHALLIGITKYSNWRHLPAARNDVEDLRDLLIDPQRIGVPPHQVQLLLDEQAGKDAILAALAKLASDAKPADTVWLFFSGHGARITAGPERGEYLVPVSAPKLSDDDFAKQAISTAQLGTALRSIRAERLVMVFDCCHAAGVAALLRGETQLGLSDETLARLAVGRGRAVLSASRADEPSRELPGARNGLFTTHLLDGLRGKAHRSGDQITVTDLFSYARAQVSKVDQTQHPVFKFETEDDFPVARWLGPERPPAATAAPAAPAAKAVVVLGTPTRASLRKAINILLVTDSDLEGFCLDHAPDIARRFSGGMERTGKVNLLLQLVDRQKFVNALKKECANFSDVEGILEYE